MGEPEPDAEYTDVMGGSEPSGDVMAPPGTGPGPGGRPAGAEPAGVPGGAVQGMADPAGDELAGPQGGEHATDVLDDRQDGEPGRA
jgi:hypothetical protein